MSPTGRTLDRLRRQGFLAETVERWLPRINRRRDLFHLADVLAVHPAEKVFLLVQCTSHGNLASRVRKCQSRPEAALWLRAGGLIQCWGWDGARLRTVNLTLEDLAGVVVTAPPRRRRLQRGERQTGLFD